MSYIESLGIKAKAVEKSIATASTIQKNNALKAISDALINNTNLIIEKNKLDLDNAIKSGMSKAMQDRLVLDENRIKAISNSIQTIMDMDDVIGSIDYGTIRPNGMRICKSRVPLGVIGIIYESRPNVTVDAAVLCLKAGNAVILKGGKEAFNSNVCLVNIMREAVETVGLPADIVQFVEDISREATNKLMRLNEYLDVLIPRGGAGLINAVIANSTVPVIETGIGNCHVYVDNTADIKMAVGITNNSKTQRPSVCNSIENLLVHKDIAEEFLPKIKSVFDTHNVEIRGCGKTIQILGETVILADENDYNTEFLDYIIAVKVVDSIDEAIAHVGKYGSKHSECIVTESLQNAEKFQREVDAAAIYVNVSTRYTDGEEFGFGAEIGISTQKLHARGPMGLKELTTVKYLINGNGQIR